MFASFEEAFCVLFVPWLVASFVVATQVDKLNGRFGASIALMIFFGPFGLIAALLLPRTPKREAEYRAEVERWHQRAIREQSQGQAPPKIDPDSRTFRAWRKKQRELQRKVKRSCSRSS